MNVNEVIRDLVALRPGLKADSQSQLEELAKKELGQKAASVIAHASKDEIVSALSEVVWNQSAIPTTGADKARSHQKAGKPLKGGATFGMTPLADIQPMKEIIADGAKRLEQIIEERHLDVQSLFDPNVQEARDLAAELTLSPPMFRDAVRQTRQYADFAIRISPESKKAHQVLSILALCSDNGIDPESLAKPVNAAELSTLRGIADQLDLTPEALQQLAKQMVPKAGYSPARANAVEIGIEVDPRVAELEEIAREKGIDIVDLVYAGDDFGHMDTRQKITMQLGITQQEMSDLLRETDRDRQFQISNRSGEVYAVVALREECARLGLDPQALAKPVTREEALALRRVAETISEANTYSIGPEKMQVIAKRMLPPEGLDPTRASAVEYREPEWSSFEQIAQQRSLKVLTDGNEIAGWSTHKATGQIACVLPRDDDGLAAEPFLGTITATGEPGSAVFEMENDSGERREFNSNYLLAVAAE